MTNPVAPEICDAKDNDCDGNVDEGIIRSCYTGPPWTLWVGECKAGTQTCSNGQWGTCQGQVTPSNEVCDGKDNDCDDVTDEGNNPCEGVCTLPYTPGTSCDGPDTDYCQEGVWQCAGINNVSCSDNTGNNVLNCGSFGNPDLTDDDCDGNIEKYYFTDSDGDGWGIAFIWIIPAFICSNVQPSGTSPNCCDCDDTDPSIYQPTCPSGFSFNNSTSKCERTPTNSDCGSCSGDPGTSCNDRTESGCWYDSGAKKCYYRINGGCNTGYGDISGCPSGWNQISCGNDGIECG